MGARLGMALLGRKGQKGTNFSVNVRASNQIMIGRLARSLYVGRITVYFSFEDIIQGGREAAMA